MFYSGALLNRSDPMWKVYEEAGLDVQSDLEKARRFLVAFGAVSGLRSPNVWKPDQGST